MADQYRPNMWTDELPHVEVWAESRSLAGVFQAQCRTLQVILYPCGGFASATLAYEAADDINRLRPVRAVVLYVGDHDPAGVLIDQALESELRRHLHVALDFRRLAINPDQIAAYDLPTKPRKAGARRRLDLEVTVEAEAMPAATMRALVWDAVEGYLPGGALEVARMSEEAARHRLRRLGESVGAHGLDAFLI